MSLQERGCCISSLQIVESGGKLHALLKHDSWLYHFEGLPLLGRDGEWEPVAQVGWSWVAVSGASAPVVFHRQDRTIVGLIRRDSDWPTFSSIPAEYTTDMGAYYLGGDRFGLALQGFPGSVQLVQVAEGELVEGSDLDGDFPFPPVMMTIMFLPHLGSMLLPFLLAIILTILMSKHRVCHYSAKGSRAPFAPLWRRAVAQLVDAAVLASPGVVIGGAAWLGLIEMRQLSFIDSPWWFFGLMLLGLVWLAAALFIFSFLEGRWGRTPGKWLAGIQVLGIDLKPCGLGRGLIRNALKFVDGFFNYMVGILIVALTENWQRVGDLAARTVVIRARRRAT